MMKRLQVLTDMVPAGLVTADIGTDHAWLPVMLVEQHKAARVYACDVRKGPLHQAAANIATNHMEKEITLVLSSGFANVPQDAQCAVIAGMGVHTIISILDADADRTAQFAVIITEANDDPITMRRWIAAKQYKITDERVISENRHDYTAIAFVPKKTDVPYTEEDLILGPILSQHPEEGYISFLKRRTQKLHHILSLRKDESSDTKKLRAEASIMDAFLQDADNI